MKKVYRSAGTVLFLLGVPYFESPRLSNRAKSYQYWIKLHTRRYAKLRYFIASFILTNIAILFLMLLLNLLGISSVANPLAFIPLLWIVNWCLIPQILFAGSYIWWGIIDLFETIRTLLKR